MRPILGQLFVGCHECKTLYFSLCDKQPIKRIAMKMWQPRDSDDMFAGYRQLLDTRFQQSIPQGCWRHGEVRPAKRKFYRSLPNAYQTEIKAASSVLQEVHYGAWQLIRIVHHPKQHLSIQ
jgi:hypothetical protein